MKKMFEVYKKLQLAKSILAGSVFLICSSYALADYDEPIKGKITSLVSHQNGCTVSLEGSGGHIYPADNKYICEFLKQAEELKEEVSLTVHVATHAWYNPWGKDTPHVGNVSFLNTKAHFTSGNKESFAFKYMLQGKVENVRYDERADDGLHTTDHCYIAINGPEVRNNLDYHYTHDMNICRLAKDAFYSGMQVRIIAEVDTHEGWANNINSFQVTQCCTRSQRN